MLSSVADSSVEHRLRQERDLYRRCLELGRVDDPAPLLADALGLLREIASAERGFIELRELASSGEDHWTADAGIDDEERERIRERISRGVIAEAIETGATVLSPSALLDDRFRGRESVRRGGIEAVLCVPVRAEDVVGVIYLQNPIRGGTFSEHDVQCVETVARFVGAVAARLLELRRRRSLDDATREIRTRLEGVSGVMGRSVVLARLLERLAIVAPMQTNVLLVGASGSGKSMLARVLHDNSSRASGPFVAINCAALPDSLVESELFGAARGAHSGVASLAVDGKVAAAEGGTLFLDEIGELPLTVQAKVLQLVQNKEFFQLGSSVVHKADVRIVAATNRDLERAVAERTFREDLYYRVRSVQLRVPSLSERNEDIAPLVEHLLEETCQRNDLPYMAPSPAVLAAVEFGEWPGNVRQLASFCEEAVINARLDHSTTIEMRHAFPRPTGASNELETTFQGARQQWERSFLSTMLARHDWNVAQTARELEMSRSHLNALIRRYELQRSMETTRST